MSDYESIFRDALPKSIVIGHNNHGRKTHSEEKELWIKLGNGEGVTELIQNAAKSLALEVTRHEYANIISTIAHVDGESRFCREVHDLNEIRITVSLARLPM